LTQLRHWLGFGIYAINTKLKYNKVLIYLFNLPPVFTRERGKLIETNRE